MYYMYTEVDVRSMVIIFRTYFSALVQSKDSKYNSRIEYIT